MDGFFAANRRGYGISAAEQPSASGLGQVRIRPTTRRLVSALGRLAGRADRPAGLTWVDVFDELAKHGIHLRRRGPGNQKLP